jgi:hypothetical protein
MRPSEGEQNPKGGPQAAPNEVRVPYPSMPVEPSLRPTYVERSCADAKEKDSAYGMEVEKT